jgi:iron(III) transport system substrate-binding protein
VVHLARLLVLTVAVAALAGCERPASGDESAGAAAASGAVAADPAKGAVNLYTARHYDADQLLYDGFTRATGIKVNVRQDRPDQLVERLRAEGEASPADVILMADAGALHRAEAAGVLQPTTSQTLEQRIPANLQDAENLWFGFSRRARVIAVDPAKINPDARPLDYADLASPAFRGQVCARPADNVYNLSLTAALIERWGRDRTLDWARGVVANFARPPQGGDIDQIRAVAAGVCGAAITNTYYWLRLARSEDPADKAVADKTRLVFPDQDGPGTHVNISGAGVAKNAPNRANAVAFLEYLASDEAQRILADANSEYPAVVGVQPPEAVARYAQFKADPMPVDVYGRRQAEAQSLLDQAGWR